MENKEPVFRKKRASSLPNPTAAYRLFYRRYLVRIQRIHLISDDEINVVGIASTGDKQFDKDLLQEWIWTYMTPVVMVEMHLKGADLIIDDPKQSVEIYNTIVEHLSDWDKELKFSLNYNNPPTDDLIVFDEFAERLWHVAKHYVKQERETVSLFKALSAIGNQNNRALTRKIAKLEPENLVDLSKKSHDPFRDSILSYDKTRGRNS